MNSNSGMQFENRNIKPTAMRELVLKVLSEQKAAISLTDLEQKFDKVDKVTLYRTLKTFEENKLIHSIDDGTGSIKYALCRESCQCHPEDLHVHFLHKMQTNLLPERHSHSFSKSSRSFYPRKY